MALVQEDYYSVRDSDSEPTPCSGFDIEAPLDWPAVGLGSFPGCSAISHGGEAHAGSSVGGVEGLRLAGCENNQQGLRALRTSNQTTERLLASLYCSWIENFPDNIHLLSSLPVNSKK